MRVQVEPNQDNRTLVDRARSGDRQAFDRLIEEHRPALERHVRTRIGEHLRSKVEVDDVLQDTYLRAWKSMDGFQWMGKGSFLRWLKGIAEHAILKLVNRHGREEVIFVEEETARPDLGPSPSKALRRGERFSRLEEALDALSPEHREAVMLVRIKGLKVKEAAERMGRTPNAVMHLLLRAMKKLKDVLGETESLHLPPRRLGDDRGVPND